jgi:hypothetical protein
VDICPDPRALVLPLGDLDDNLDVIVTIRVSVSRLDDLGRVDTRFGLDPPRLNALDVVLNLGYDLPLLLVVAGSGFPLIRSIIFGMVGS